MDRRRRAAGRRQTDTQSPGMFNRVICQIRGSFKSSLILCELCGLRVEVCLRVFVLLRPRYSLRSATIGFTRVALSAGSRLATTATTVRTAGTVMKVAGSLGSTS